MAGRAVLLLEVDDRGVSARDLTLALGIHLRAPKEVVVPLEDGSPEEVLSACLRAGVAVRRSRVIVGRDRG